MDRKVKSTAILTLVFNTLHNTPPIDQDLLVSQRDLVFTTLPRFDWDMVETINFIIRDFEYTEHELQEYKLIPVLFQNYCKGERVPRNSVDFKEDWSNLELQPRATILGFIHMNKKLHASSIYKSITNCGMRDSIAFVDWVVDWVKETQF